jgi:hypothetical protein
MALVCSKCSAENADGALVCRQCGAALPPPASWSRSLLPDDDHFDPLSAPTLVMQHTAPAALPPIEETAVPMPVRSSGRTLLLGLATGVLLVAAAAWLLRPGEPSSPAPGPAASTPSRAAASAPPAASAPVPSQPLAAASAVRPPAMLAAASAPTAAMAAASAAPAHGAASTAPAAASTAVTDTRKRIPEPVARKRALSAAPAAASAAPASATAEPVAAPPAAPERQKTVSELCAAGNLITRGFCEQRECRRPEHAADPLCVKLKDVEQRRLFQQ